MQEAFDALVKFQMLNQFDSFMGFLDPKAEDPEIKLKKYLTSWCQKNEQDWNQEFHFIPELNEAKI